MSRPDITRTKPWKNLETLAASMRHRHLRDLFADDPQRFEYFSLRHGGILLDFSKQRITREIWEELHTLWRESNAQDLIEVMRNGEPVNCTENRSVLHHALRHQGNTPIYCHGRDVMPEVRTVLQRMKEFCAAIHQQRWRGSTGRPIRHVVNIGIGGSDLGARMAVQALTSCHVADLSVHFVANLDGAELDYTLRRLDPQESLFIVASKTFTTQETMRNALSARAWLTAALGEESVACHFVAVSTQIELASKFGIHAENVFEFWEWVGGRFSIWSAVGLPLALAIGFENFERFLSGAAEMDSHFFDSADEKNMPLSMALIDLWNTNFMGAETRAVLPYSHSLGLLPRYLQQLEMESNGKSASRDGQPLNLATAPITWGEAGTNGQHAFYQLVHQGGRYIPCEFLAFIRPDHALMNHHSQLLANCFAQSEALMRGKTLNEVECELTGADVPRDVVQKLSPFKVFPGNQPSTTLLIDELTPSLLGQLLAIYEHKTACLGAAWNLNSFDQWGVEYGKELAGRLVPALEGGATAKGIGGSTASLIDEFIKRRM